MHPCFLIVDEAGQTVTPNIHKSPLLPRKGGNRATMVPIMHDIELPKDDGELYMK